MNEPGRKSGSTSEMFYKMEPTVVAMYLLNGFLGGLVYRLTPPRNPWSDLKETARSLLVGLIVGYLYGVALSWRPVDLQIVGAIIPSAYYGLDFLKAFIGSGATFLEWLRDHLKPPAGGNGGPHGGWPI
ncbi:MAG: hypothetical protein V1857_06220 [archaeon]